MSAAASSRTDLEKRQQMSVNRWNSASPLKASSRGVRSAPDHSISWRSMDVAVCDKSDGCLKLDWPESERWLGGYGAGERVLTRVVRWAERQSEISRAHDIKSCRDRALHSPAMLSHMQERLKMDPVHRRSDSDPAACRHIFLTPLSEAQGPVLASRKDPLGLCWTKLPLTTVAAVSTCLSA